MASTTSKMALAIWDRLSDVFAHDTIRQNLLKIDVHDHTTGKGAPIPSAGIKDGAITAPKIGSGVGDSAYREVVMGRAFYGSAHSTAGPLTPHAVHTPMPSLGYTGVFYFDPADWGVTPGQTGKLKFTGHLVTNGVAPAASVTFAIYPVTGHSNGTLTLGTVLPNSDATITTPSANSVSATFSASSIAVPAAGLYVMYITPSAMTAAGSNVALYARLLVRNG